MDRMKRKNIGWTFWALIAVVAVLTSCGPNPLPDTNTDQAPSSDNDSSSAEADQSAGEIEVTMEDLPPYICIGGDYQITIRWTENGEEIVDGQIQWTIDYSRAAQGTTSGIQHRKAIFMTMDNSPQKEAVSALVKIENAEYSSGLVDLFPVVGEAKQEAEFIYCEYNLNLGYQGSYNNGIFAISENANMAVPIWINEENGAVKGEGTIGLHVIQTINQSGVSCDVSWQGDIPVTIGGQVGDGKITLQVGSENTVIEDSMITCTAEGQTFSVPAAGGPINLSALGFDSLIFPIAGGSQTLALSSGVFSGGSGTGGVTIVLEPKK
jgi:hypothetical protein